jgi:hypothetical protein
LRSASVSVSSKTTTIVSGPAKSVRVLVGPRPNCRLYSRTISLEIAAATLKSTGSDCVRLGSDTACTLSHTAEANARLRQRPDGEPRQVVYRPSET